MLTVAPRRCPATETAAMTGMKCHQRDKQSQREKGKKKVSEGEDGGIQHTVTMGGGSHLGYAVIERAGCL